MRKVSLNRWLIVTVLFAIFANIAHPVTPRFLKQLQLGDSIFGYVFAAMAFTNFFFSPLWAKLAKKYSSVNVTVITLVFYGFSQLMFGLSTNFTTIIIARLIGGFFIGGLHVAQLLYIVDNSDGQIKTKAMLNNATLQIVFGTIGYFIGGVIGDKSILSAFYFQVVGLMITAFYTFFFIKDRKKPEIEINLEFSDFNPLAKVYNHADKSNNFINVMLIIAFLASSASVLYDQTFNYYMADYFNFMPSVNGFIKATTGIFAFVSNSTLIIFLLRKYNNLNILGYVFFISSFLILFLINLDNAPFFLMTNILYFTVNAAYLPILQNLVTNSASDQNSIIGSLNALKSLGMIVGAIFAGILYTYNKKLPFIISIIIFVISTLIIYKLVKKQN